MVAIGGTLLPSAAATPASNDTTSALVTPANYLRKLLAASSFAELFLMIRSPLLTVQNAKKLDDPQIRADVEKFSVTIHMAGNLQCALSDYLVHQRLTNLQVSCCCIAAAKSTNVLLPQDVYPRILSYVRPVSFYNKAAFGRTILYCGRHLCAEYARQCRRWDTIIFALNPSWPGLTFEQVYNHARICGYYGLFLSRKMLPSRHSFRSNYGLMDFSVFEDIGLVVVFLDDKNGEKRPALVWDDRIIDRAADGTITKIRHLHENTGKTLLYDVGEEPEIRPEGPANDAEEED